MRGMRFRPRFTLRTLAILVTVTCGYLGAWEVTKREAEQERNGNETWLQDGVGEAFKEPSGDYHFWDVVSSADGPFVDVKDAVSPCPLIVKRWESVYDHMDSPNMSNPRYRI